MKILKNRSTWGRCAIALIMVATTSIAYAEDRQALDADVHAAIAHLLDTTPAAKGLAPTAKAALIFPNVVKAGFILGTQYGQGALVKRNASGEGYYISDYFSLTAASYGLQAGIQTFGYAMVLMTDAAVQNVETSAGFELGVGPSVVIVDAGVAKTLTTKTANSDVYAFTFGQKGLMAGMGLQG
jgi:lipid-binding SYLF domain-containing protein